MGQLHSTCTAPTPLASLSATRASIPASSAFKRLSTPKLQRYKLNVKSNFETRISHVRFKG
jgi:hypothetical protein